MNGPGTNGSVGQDEVKTKILVCVPWIKVEPRFLKQFPEWFAANKFKHNLTLMFEIYRPLHEVQQKAAAYAGHAGFTHVLFMEDDHWGWPASGLEALLAEDKDVIGFPTYSKHPPYLALCKMKVDPELSFLQRKANLVPAARGMGPEVQEVDLLTWAFTLVKTSVFLQMEEAEKDPFYQYGPMPTDSFFSEYCEQLGIKRYVHHGFMIGHGKVKPEHIPMMRRCQDAINAYEHRFARQAVPDDFDPNEPKEAPALSEDPVDVEYREAAEALMAEYENNDMTPETGMTAHTKTSLEEKS